MKKLLLIALILFVACNESSTPRTDNVADEAVNLKYATGFTISSIDNHKLITINSPWPDADTSFSYLVLNKDHENQMPVGLNKYDHVITAPIDRIVVTSTTHIPAIEMLDVPEKLVGFPGCDYISSKITRGRIDKGLIRELGKNESINTEVLLEVNPQAVITFGVKGTNKTVETIERANIPVLYNGDWVEASPLAKAEWIKFFGVLFNKERMADSLFNEIENNYLEAMEIAAQVKQRPTVMSGAMHKDVWYLPNGSSPEAQFLKDANVNYLWAETQGQGSLALSFESVLEKAQEADIWLSPSYYRTMDDLEASNPHYAQFKPFIDNQIFSFSNTVGEKGGVLYYELGVSRPDLVLKDIIKICHPDLLENYNPFFFKALK